MTFRHVLLALTTLALILAVAVQPVQVDGATSDGVPVTVARYRTPWSAPDATLSLRPAEWPARSARGGDDGGIAYRQAEALRGGRYALHIVLVLAIGGFLLWQDARHRERPA